MEPKKILIVEDDFIIATSTCVTLKRNGYECLSVESGEKAIEVIDEYKPDLGLMDIGLSGKIDGISTAGIIRMQNAMPIIFITEQTNKHVFRQAKTTVPQNFIQKPYTDDVLLRAIEIALVQLPFPQVSDPTTSLGERVTDGIFVFAGTEYKKVFFREILYLEAQGVSTIMYCDAKKCYKISLSSNNVIIQLACPSIIKTSRSFYVNIQRIESIKNDELIIGDASIPMGKNYKAEILRCIKRIHK